MKLVRQMIKGFLSNPRSIILYIHKIPRRSGLLILSRAVVPANVDIATQEIIQMAEDADPNDQRTLRVLTKPDLVDKGAEDKARRSFLVLNYHN